MKKELAAAKAENERLKGQMYSWRLMMLRERLLEILNKYADARQFMTKENMQASVDAIFKAVIEALPEDKQERKDDGEVYAFDKGYNSAIAELKSKLNNA